MGFVSFIFYTFVFIFICWLRFPYRITSLCGLSLLFSAALFSMIHVDFLSNFLAQLSLLFFVISVYKICVNE